MRPNEVLVTWFIGKKGSYVWSVSKDAPAQFKAIPLTQDQLRKSITQIRKSLDPDVTTVEEIPAFNFVAVANVIKYIGASIIFIDIEEKTMGVDPSKLKEFLK